MSDDVDNAAEPAASDAVWIESTDCSIVCEVRRALEHFVDDDETADDVSTIDLVLRALDYLSRAESELELAQTWGAALVDRIEAADDVLVALVLRAAREIPEPRARRNLLADLLAERPDALDGLSAPELERLRGRA